MPGLVTDAGLPPAGMPGAAMITPATASAIAMR